ncbi:glycosyltransferase family 4 protein [Parasphingorhabdus sp.]|jgi:glycosyltransferase involved in cell wall biosynthesis|uniref:glycosyltransferase family 4 protein n=1 Tax=Parasphingorhabdus sp. TaxID=2709688 RepID=UPI003BAFA5B2
MKVAVTGLRGIPNVMGGVETHCEEMLPRVKGLDPDLNITVFARAPYVKKAEYKYRGVSVISVSSPVSVWREAITSTFNAILAARRKKMDIIHIHAIGPALLTPLARLMGLKVVLTHHGEDYNRAKWGRFPRFVLRMGERLGLWFANHVIAVSPSLARKLQNSFPGSTNRISYIPNGAPELPRAPGDALARFKLESNKYVLAVGRLVPEKGLHDLIKAHADIHDGRKLVIVGGADHSSKYSESLLKLANDRVIFTGLQDRGTLRELYENAALFVMPSYHEGLPIAALEAGSCSTPMLLSDIQPNRDIGLPEGDYFPVGDTSALAEALNKPYYLYRVDAAEFRKKFDWDEIALNTSSIYRKVMS